MNTPQAEGHFIDELAALLGERVTTSIPGWQLLLGGLFVGYGARLGGGCASGHGICGIGSFHLPSVVAVLTFMATGLLTANLITRWF